MSVYNSFNGITLWIGLTRPSAPAHTTCRIGLSMVDSDVDSVALIRKRRWRLFAHAFGDNEMGTDSTNMEGAYGSTYW